MDVYVPLLGRTICTVLAHRDWRCAEIREVGDEVQGDEAKATQAPNLAFTALPASEWWSHIAAGRLAGAMLFPRRLCLLCAA